MKLRLMITKDQEICFLSHLEYMKTIERAIKRAKLPVAYSEGFNPHMKFSLASALGVGVSSHAEHCELELSEDMDAKMAVQQLQAALPRGIRVLKFDVADKKAAKLMASVQAANYIVQFDKTASIEDSAALIAQYQGLTELKYEKKMPKNRGMKTVDIKEFVGDLSLNEKDTQIQLAFSCKITNEGSLKAAEIAQVLASLWNLPVDMDSIEILRTDLYKFDKKGKRIELLSC